MGKVRVVGMSRRAFLKYASLFTAGSGLVLGCADEAVDKDVAKEADDETAVAVYPVAEGFLLVDVKKCQGCMSCMLACSLVNEGVESLSLARLQVMQNSFEKWPLDLTIEQCRQCKEAFCVQACNFDALWVDEERGSLRVVREEKCTGCGACVAACPFAPKRPVIAPNTQGDLKSRKCDLCADAPYHWAAEGGGPNGQQACVTICPLRAIAFTSKEPLGSDGGYRVNLRDDATWSKLGFPTD